MRSTARVCSLLLLTSTFAGCGHDSLTRPGTAPDQAWQLEATDGSWIESIWGDSEGSVFALTGGGGFLSYDGLAWSVEYPFMQGRMFDIWGTSASDVFAVGATGSIFHYDGTSWRQMSSGVNGSLRAVWGSATNNVYAVGDDATILRYDGNVWSSVHLPGDMPVGRFTDVWGSSDNDIFLSGNNAILHYDGSSWKASLDIGANALWGSATNNVFAVGVDSDAVFHYDGNTWIHMETGTGQTLWAVWGTSTSDVFVVADESILHYDGSQWTEPMRIPARSDDFRPHYSAALWAIWGRGHSFFVGGLGFHHFDGSSWQPALGIVTSRVAEICGVDHEAFALGRGPGDGIFRYDGVSWEFIARISSAYIHAAWAASGNEVFAVGAPEHGGDDDGDGFSDGLALHYNGNEWRYERLPRGLQGVWGNSAVEVFAVGVAGGIYHYNGSAWSSMTSGVTADLRAVWGTSSSDVFAVGEGVILHFDGSIWSVMGNHGSYSFEEIWGSSSHDVFAVGRGGVILHYDGKAWVSMSGGSEQIWDIWGRSGSDVYAAGEEGILHYDGSAWAFMDVGRWSRDFGGYPRSWSIWGGDNGAVLAAGTGGVYRLSP